MLALRRGFNGTLRAIIYAAVLMHKRKAVVHSLVGPSGRRVLHAFSVFSSGSMTPITKSV